MKISEYKKLRQHLELQKKAIQDQIDHLEEVYALSREVNKKVVNPDRPRRGEISRIVKEIVGGMSAEFDIREVEKAVAMKAPFSKITRGQITTILMRMKNDGALIVSGRGSGRRPSVYTKKTFDAEVA